MIKKTIVEGESKTIIYEPKSGIVSKDLPVFYNPLMKFNRDISILLLNSIDNTEMQIADPLAGSGIRSVRFLTELTEDKIKNIKINDYDEMAVKLIKENLALNEENLNCNEIEVSNLDANLFLEQSVGFDYIDIDPFGSPNMFLDSSLKRISRKGILAVTATDTSALSGTYQKAGFRKYWATMIRQEHKHEAGVRILIRKCQLIGAQYDKAIIPILSYSVDHYFRIFFKVIKGKEKVDEVLKNHEYFHYCSTCGNQTVSRLNREICCDKPMQMAGPLWSGELFDSKLITKMVKDNKISENEKVLQTFLDESRIEVPFFYDIHALCKKNKLGIPRTSRLIEQIMEKGFKVSRTHFLRTALKTDMPFKEFLELMK
jgi:tRNA (guanine26-N2/guanine27-N2)-dimethyltransferase